MLFSATYGYEVCRTGFYIICIHMCCFSDMTHLRGFLYDLSFGWFDLGDFEFMNNRWKFLVVFLV